MYQLSHEQLETQARAKITWGEEPEKVVIFLISYGLTSEEAWGMVQELQIERQATIRASGVKKIIMGVIMILVPVGVWVAFQSAGFMSVKLLGIAVAVGVWGIWKLISGILNLLFPESEQGDLAEDSES